jgi:FtsZ-binding cell division protein ZapB
LIAGYEAHIQSADERIRLARLEIESLKQLSALERQRAAELQNVIDAERAAKTKLLELKELQEKRIAKLEGRAKFWRKAAGFFGVAAGVAILIVIAK